MNTGFELSSTASSTNKVYVIPGLSRNLLNFEPVAPIEEIPALKPE